MKRPIMLDLFSGAGGCAMGYHRAGFDVVGIDHRPQKRYPFSFMQGDAMEVLQALANGGMIRVGRGEEYDLGNISVIHASPPCQAYSRCRNMTWLAGLHYPDYLRAVIILLEGIRKPWIVENVPGAPMSGHALELCGTSFGLRVRRHRLFASSAFLFGHASPCRHRAGDITIAGNRFSIMGFPVESYQCSDGSWRHRNQGAGIAEARAAMGIDWMTRAELAQAIPPAYTEWIGKQYMAMLRQAA